MPVSKRSKTQQVKNSILPNNINLNNTNSPHFKENKVNTSVLTSQATREDAVAKILFPSSPAINPTTTKPLGKQGEALSPVVLSPLPISSYISCGKSSVEVMLDEDDCWEREWGESGDKEIVSKAEEGAPETPEKVALDLAEAERQRMRQRLKQIEYGKRTVGYQRFIAMVPVASRLPSHPTTPRPNQKCSKRSWDGQIRKWRRELHKWDPTDEIEYKYYEDIVLRKYGSISRGEEEREERAEGEDSRGGEKKEERRERIKEERSSLHQENLSAESPPFLPRCFIEEFGVAVF